MRDNSFLIIAIVCFSVALLVAVKGFAFEYCITIPDGEVSRLATALQENNNYSDTLDDGVTPNPESAQDFAKRMPREYLKGQYVQYWGVERGEALKRQKIEDARSAFGD